ncbi:isoprenylcysteine carboxylmethyltransferase family protein [Rhizobium sp. TRM95111]|uniref:methyltransferase family protein n=1 Tax=Rhizobium alarense TaxID=2846851 RepID=UPI001F300666|nr:isoprenylcysteine carboxylmethyltransferase family protein [Rhizobium alarense]MCF3639768.1 isoprenylcysteine carboxylmethyltransferase family protein [Rhizobium alarense]
MNAYRSKPFVFPWPPLVFAAAILSALTLQRFFPVIMPDTNVLAWRAVGFLLIGAAVCLDVWAMRTLLDNHTTVLPHRCSSHLVTTGPYRFTRNPIYLGYTLITTGIGLILQNPWFLAGAVAAIAVTTVISVRREELHLLSRFGIEFETYCRRTARWI